ncbi:hypothetical protein L873DRAFT_1714618 [Choiromyces venosus 120613-1]|uniref:histidine kinase n=1 Tax=Choiromyces venosus 120613-1 TaxID=1336337 RepID=A0A3N4IZ76_9PEZI|nr:hypothetical protein L873DRAFT_1714618 [Choiromyces venosus 120613-1]
MESEKSLKSYEAIDMSDPFNRSSFCIGTSEMESVIQLGDPRFQATLRSAFVEADSKGLEETFNLKQKLRSASTFDFWQILMEGMSEIMGAQYAFVAKRVLEGDEYSAVEMPEFGERGSCLMGLAFYFNDHKGSSGLYRDFKFKVYGCPCQWMKHDKVLLIPEGLKALTPENPNAEALPILPEGYLAVPLFHKGKCFAHMGVMWTEEGLKERSISWAMLEMFLHTLEDQVTARVVEGEGFGPKMENEVIPNDAVASRQSLKPYARSLSHELRTPMQGVVGMLDVMYASVLEATEWEAGDMRQIRNMVESLRESIEVAQDSSKRAVDAADNMVHAYDFDMEVPSTPKMASQVLPDLPDESDATLTPMQGSDFDPSTPRVMPRQSSKRRRESGSPEDVMPHKMRHRSEGLDQDGDGDEILGPPLLPRSRSLSPHSYTGSPARLLMPDILQRGGSSGHSMLSAASPSPSGAWLFFDAAGKIQLNSRPLKIRELLSQILHETLRSGGRPDSTQSSLTPEGERIIVSSMGPGEMNNTVEIELKVDESVPETLVVDGNALTKLLSSVFHNAVKFTGNGGITVVVGVVNPVCPQVLFSITDTGEGIPEEFLPRLFKAFSREDASMTRQRDGLGLGLLVAKGIARKMGGDLWCERTSTEGPDKGSEFRVRLPLKPGDASSTPGTPVVNPNTPTITPPLSVLPNPLPNWSLDTSHRSPFTNLSSLHDERFPSPPPPPSQPLLPPTSDSSTSLSTTPHSPHNPRPIDLTTSPATTATTTTTTTPTPHHHHHRRRPPPKLPYDKTLAAKIPLSILVAEDNKINRKLLISMLRRLGYTDIFEACDGQEAVEIMSLPRHPPIDVVLMDLWMPRMDGYEATKHILESRDRGGARAGGNAVTVLAVSADATQAAMVKTSSVGMKGFMSKPYKIVDLERLIVEFCGVGVDDE